MTDAAPTKNQLEVAVRQRVPSPTAALNALIAMEKELSAKRTYDEIRRVIQEVEAIKVLYQHIEAVKVQAENTVLIAKRRIGEELKRVPKALGGGQIPKNGNNDRVKSTSGKSATGITPMQRSRLAKLAAVPVEKIKEVAEDLRAAGKDATPNAVITALTQDEKTKRQVEREQVLAEKQLALHKGLYSVLLADPPYSRGLDAIKTLEVPAAGSSVLFLWAPPSKLTDALDVMRAWRFTYRSNLVWTTGKMRADGWTRCLHQLLLIGTRGDISSPAVDQRPISVVNAPADERDITFRELITSLFPNTPKVELFARAAPGPGWDAWSVP